MTGGEIVLRFLLEQGMGTGFGIPGALNAHLYDAIHRLNGEFRHVLVRHELGGAWMADGYARARNEVGVAFTVPGPGATHAASAVAGAYTDCSRVLLLSSQSESSLRGEFRRDLFHGLDQQRLFAPITKWSAAVHRVEEIVPTLTEAFHHLRRGRPGPVQVEIPADVLGAEGGSPALPGFISASRQEPAVERIQAAVQALRSAARPLILAGDGVLHADATETLGELATLLRAPVITTVLGKGALPETHAWSLGDSNSAAGSQAYGEHDLLLAVGERFTQVDTRWPWFFPPKRLIHLDADAREIGRLYAPEVGVVGDVQLGLRHLMDAFRANPGDRSGWDALYPSLKLVSDQRDAHPFMQSLRRALPDDALTAWDVCYPGFLSRKDWFSYVPHAHYYPGVYVGMGFGLPVGIGAQLARPDRTTCVIAGDGGFQMTMAELGTAIQQRLPLVVVLINNEGLTLIRRVQDRDFGGRRCEVDLVNPDFVALAGAYGIPAQRVETFEALEEAVSCAVRSRELSFIEFRGEIR